MKRCPECRRDYYDDSLHYCLDDGAALLEGPASADDPETAILSEPGTGRTGSLLSEAPTRSIDPSSSRASSDQIPPQASTRNTVIAVGISAVLLAALAVASYIYFGRGAAKQIDSIAVMPFVNESGNPEIEYLSDGMTDSLISSLSRLAGVTVQARSSVFRYKGQNVDAPAIGKQLGVQAVLNGRVLQRGSDLTLFVELVDATSEKVLWSENYNRSMTNLVSLQSELASDVSQKLKARLSSAETQQMRKTDTKDPEAYRLYLVGRYEWNKRNVEGMKKANENFQRAIDIDPNYAKAYAGLADTYSLYFDDSSTPSTVKIPEARHAATKALDLDDSLADAHASLGLIHLAEYNFADAVRELKRAIDLDANYASAHQWYANILSSLGKHEEALSENRRAIEIEPRSVVMNNAYGVNLFHARRYDEALAQAERTIQMDPSDSRAYSLRGSVYSTAGRYGESVENFARARELFGDADGSAPKMRKAFADGGWRTYLTYGTKDRRWQNFPYTLARLYLQLGDKDEAFRQLNRAYEMRQQAVTRLKTDPRLDALRDDPRYFELLRKMGFPE